MEKVRVERITHFQKDRNDQPLISKKSGKPYERCYLQTNKGTLSGFGSDITHNLKEGDEIELDIISKEYNGKTYLNFSIPKPKVVDYFEFIALTARVEALEKKVSPIEEQVNEVFDLQDPYPPQEPI